MLMYLTLRGSVAHVDFVMLLLATLRAIPFYKFRP